MTTKEDVRTAVSAAATEAVEGAEGAEGTVSTEATATETPVSDASSEGTPASAEAATEASDGTVTEYFGYKLPPGLTPEERGEFLTELRKRDDEIGKLLRGKEGSEAAPPAPAPEPEPELTDEDILQMLGLDPNNPFSDETAKAIVPVVRKQVQQEQMIGQLLEMQELAEIDRSWRSSLSGLEKEFGSLPAEVNHDAVMEFAAENGIANPVDAYWRIAGPGRQAVESLATARAKALQEAKAASATTRPAGTNADDEPPLESKTTKGATNEAARRVLRSLGLDA